MSDALHTFAGRLRALRELGPDELLRETRIGLEKESLRVAPDGVIAQTDHPAGLGAALTHPRITTDYGEALLELITRPQTSVQAALAELDLLHRWTYANLEHGEFLWATSMPCRLRGEESIRIAEYGPSNAGFMKTVYRRGLGYRYGKTMQVIAGVHFNYSLPDAFWRVWRERLGDARPLREFRSEAYMAMLRNLQRFGWIVPYLYGASPAVCESFLGGAQTTLEFFGHHTYYEHYATSLRLGDIGYQNRREGELGVRISYNDLPAYIASLEAAITTPCPVWARIGVCVNGEWRQLNANRLQIENEYYSSVRAKAVVSGLTKPVRALQRQGVEYIELRSVDVNAFEPLGVSEHQLCFLEALMVYALLLPSPPLDAEEQQLIDANLNLVAHSGRDPQLALLRRGGEIYCLRDWAGEVLNDMAEICAWLDAAKGTDAYTRSLARQLDKVRHPAQIAATRMMDTLAERRESFFEFALRQSRQIAERFAARPPSAAERVALVAEVERSRAEAEALAASDRVDFATFLADYFAQ